MSKYIIFISLKDRWHNHKSLDRTYSHLQSGENSPPPLHWRRLLAPILFGDSPMLGVYVMPTVLNNKLDCLWNISPSTDKNQVNRWTDCLTDKYRAPTELVPNLEKALLHFLTKPIEFSSYMWQSNESRIDHS